MGDYYGILLSTVLTFAYKGYFPLILPQKIWKWLISNWVSDIAIVVSDIGMLVQ